MKKEQVKVMQQQLKLQEKVMQTEQIKVMKKD